MRTSIVRIILHIVAIHSLLMGLSLAAQPIGEYGLDTETVVLLHANDNAGSVVADASGNGFNGAATGTSVVPGVFGSARRFTNDVTGIAADYITLGNSAAFNPPALTFDAWINMATSAEGLVNGIPIITREDSYAGDEAYSFEIASPCDGIVNGLHIYDGEISLCSSRGLALNRWYHAAFTMDE